MSFRLKENLFPLFAGWMTMIGFDFFLHGGLLANLYTRESSFLVPAELAFSRIPIGYFSFLILCFVLVWLLKLTGVKGRMGGMVFGVKFGFLVWGALVFGLYSISTARIDLLVGWWIGQTIELGLAGFVVGAHFDGLSKKHTVFSVLAFITAMLVLTILLQIAGFAQPMKTI